VVVLGGRLRKRSHLLRQALTSLQIFHVYICGCVSKSVCVCVCGYLCAFVGGCMHVRVCVLCMYTYTHFYLCPNVCVYCPTYRMCAYMCGCLRSHMHIPVCVSSFLLETWARGARRLQDRWKICKVSSALFVRNEFGRWLTIRISISHNKWNAGARSANKICSRC